VAGTHGKTTTTGMLAWILERAGHDPGFLVGGVPGNFAVSARLGGGRDFVIEADEYDTAFFDKRSKFIHYRPRIAVLNNLEFDHADIFDDLEAIRRQFHHLVRTVPGNGKLVVNQEDAQLREVLERGCWTPVDGFGDEATGAGWQLRASCPDFSEFQVRRDGVPCGDARIPLPGRHNAMNALAAIAAAAAAGVAPGQALEALADFIPPKRRLELRGETGGVSVYDDFAHHPTAIRATLEACRARYPGERLVAVLEPRSNTMRMGRHRAELASALAAADRVLLLEPAGLGWSLAEVARELGTHAAVLRSTEEIVADLTASSQPGDRVIVMSNGSFDGLHARLLSALEQRADS
jgi:UDP-N-acetylmuramate: L-alanyl-gamma-D-glutamyl-meso-diaminopimelate ligase